MSQGLKIGEAFVVVKPDTGNFANETEKGVGGALGRITGAVGGAIGMVAKATVAAGGASLASLVTVGVGYNSLEQKSRAAFTTILGSSAAANTMMDKVAAFGKTSPFPRQAFISATQQLLGFGFAADDIVPTLGVIQDTVAAIGGGAEEIATITDVFARIKSQGKITGDEVNRLGAVGVNAVDLIAKASGKTGDAIRKDISSGSIDAGTALAGLTSGMKEKFGGAAANVKNTWSGAVDRVKGAWRDLGSALVEPFIGKKGGGMAVEWANKLADKLRVMANGAPAVIAGITAIVAVLKTGDFKGTIFGQEEDSKLVDWIFNVREAFFSLVGIVRVLKNGDFSGPIFNQEEDSKFVDVLFRIREGFFSLKEIVSNLDFSSVSGFMASAQTQSGGLSDKFAGMKATAQGLGGAVKNLGGALAGMGSGGGQIAANLMNVLAGSLGFFADHTTLATVAILAMTAGFAASGPVMEAYHAAYVIRTPLMVVQTAVQWANTRALAANTASQASNTGAQSTGIIATVRNTVAKTAAAVASGVQAAATGVATAAQRLFNAALSANPIALVVIAIVALVAGLVWFFTQTEIGQKIITAVWGAIKTAIAATVVWITGTAIPAVGAAFQWVVGKAKWVLNLYVSIWKAIGQAVWTAIVFVKDTIVSVISSVASWLIGAWNGIRSNASAAWVAVKALVSSAVNGLRSAVTSVIGAVRSWLSGAWSNIRGAARAAWDGIVSAVREAVNRVSSVVNGVIGTIKGYFSNAGSWLSSAGRNIVTGLWNGLSGAAGWLYSKVAGFAGGIVSSALGALGINSPSRVFRDRVGAMIPAGLAVGMDANLGMIKNASARMIDATMPTTIPRIPIGGGGLPGGRTAAGVAAAGTADGGRGGITVQNLTLAVDATMNLSDPVEWQRLIESIRDGLNRTERAYA